MRKALLLVLMAALFSLVCAPLLTAPLPTMALTQIQAHTPLQDLFLNKLRPRAVHVVTTRGFGCGTIYSQELIKNTNIYKYVILTVNHLFEENVKAGDVVSATILDCNKEGLNSTEDIYVIEKQEHADFFMFKFCSFIDLGLKNKLEIAEPQLLEQIMLVGTSFHLSVKPILGHVALTVGDYSPSDRGEDFFFVGNISNGPGFSGSGVFNMNGELVGLFSSRFLETPWNGFMVKVSTLKDLIVQ